MAWLRRLLRKRFLLLLIPLGTLGAFVWQIVVIPPVPVFQGHRLSWWLRHQSEGGVNSLSGNDLRAIGPAATRWLAYTAEHGRIPDGQRYPKDELGRWLRQIRDGFRDVFQIPDDSYDERREALYQLNKMGSDAAPAIPTLVRILETDAANYGTAAADALLQSGPPARAAVLGMFENGSHVARVCLIMNLPHYGAAPAENLEYLMVACRDPDPQYRLRALHGLKAFGGPTGFRVEMKPAVPIAIELLSNPSVKPKEAIDLLAWFREQAAPAIPQLVALLDSPDPNVRSSAISTLIAVDPKGQAIAPQVRIFLQSSDPVRQETARLILGRFGELPDE